MAKALIAEGDQMLTEVCQAHLTLAGYDATLAHDDLNALNVIHQLSPNL